MNSLVRLTLAMGSRVSNFLSTRPFGAQLLDAVVAELGELVARGKAVALEESVGHRAERAATQHRKELKHVMRSEALTHLVRIGKAAAKEKSELATRVRVPLARSNEVDFLTTAQTIAAEAAANRELFVKYGMVDGVLDTLNKQLEEYGRLVVAGDAGRAAHTGARTEAKALKSAVIAKVKQIEGMLVLQFRENPNLLGAWKSARNVAWPEPPETEPVPVPVNKDSTA
ncbi:MAG: hypothetical protein ABI647_25460 [Gemmatimonadota bacterium]